MTIFSRILIPLLIFTPWAVLAQGVSDFYHTKPESGKKYGLRAGINYSFPIATSEPLPQASHWGSVLPRYGFFISSFYSKSILKDQLSLRVDATFQQKSIGSQYANSPLVRIAAYDYVGMNPQIGLHLTNQVTLLAGVEANLLVGTQTPFGKAFPLDVGPTFRLTCMLGCIGAEVSYFKGFTKFTQLTVPYPGLKPFDFYNQNVQMSLIYTWGRN